MHWLQIGVEKQVKKTLRCRECNLKNKSLNKTGRKTGICLTCGTKLSTKNNKTGKCKKCFHTDIIPWNKGVTGFVPWNKGKSILVSLSGRGDKDIDFIIENFPRD